jgi:hypothetical protein
LIGIAREVSVADDVVALVVVAEDDDPGAESFACSFDLLRDVFVGHDEEIFERPDCFSYCGHTEMMALRKGECKRLAYMRAKPVSSVAGRVAAEC